MPGCESPWGIFSAASPLLDGALGDGTGDGSSACANSAVRGRYGMSDPIEAQPASAGGG
ncbi:hypothetical protein BH24ACT4_BH24ACT4_19210 [soil metagenome]